MNDNQIRGIQWQKMIGDYFTPRYGGEKYQWAEGNFDFIRDFSRDFNQFLEVKPDIDYRTWHNNYITNWVESMFNHINIEPPPKSEYKRIFAEVTEMITPNVRATFPGVVNSIKKLKKLGFKLYTASAEHSNEIKGYLRGMGVKDCFEEFYGPDLINTHKADETFYEKIFNLTNVEPKQAVVIDDNPRFVEIVKNIGANVVQVCVSRDYEPIVEYFVDDMNELPETIINLVNNLKK